MHAQKKLGKHSPSTATTRTKAKKSVLKTQKRHKHKWAGRITPRTRIPVKTTGPDDYLNVHPEIGQYFEDPQGHEPWDLEGRGALNLQKEHNNIYRLMAGVHSPAFPAKIGFTKQDTLYTYGRRVARLERKYWINALREMEEKRIERNYQIASRQAQEVKDRSAIYQAWRLRRKNNRMYDHTVRTQKHAAALAASYARGQETERQRRLATAKINKQYIELMCNERRTTWIEDPDNVDPSIFTVVEHPTGWWPNDDTRQLTYNKFDTDDYDIEKYFTTTFPPYTNIRPRREGTSEFYDVIQNGEVGWRRENKALGDKIYKYTDPNRRKKSTKTYPTPQLELPSEEDGSPELVNAQEARSGIRTRTYLLHDKMPGQMHTTLRNLNTASAVENPSYKQKYSAESPFNPDDVSEFYDDDYDDYGHGDQRMDNNGPTNHRRAM